MSKEMKSLFLMIVGAFASLLLPLALFVFCIYLINSGLNDIVNNGGLKTIFGELWNGKP